MPDRLNTGQNKLFTPSERYKMKIFSKSNISRIFILTLMLGTASQSGLASTTSSDNKNAQDKVFNLDKKTGYTDYRAQLKNYAIKNNPKSANEFCIIGYENLSNPQDPFSQAIIYWKQGRKIIFWDGGLDMNVFSNELNLATDVVKSPKDVGTSTYLVTEKWVSDYIQDCQKHGVTVKYTASDLQ